MIIKSEILIINRNQGNLKPLCSHDGEYVTLFPQVRKKKIIIYINRSNSRYFDASFVNFCVKILFKIRCYLG